MQREREMCVNDLQCVRASCNERRDINAEREREIAQREMCVNDLQCVRASCNECEMTVMCANDSPNCADDSPMIAGILRRVNMKCDDVQITFNAPKDDSPMIAGILRRVKHEMR